MSLNARVNNGRALLRRNTRCVVLSHGDRCGCAGMRWERGGRERVWMRMTQRWVFRACACVQHVLEFETPRQTLFCCPVHQVLATSQPPATHPLTPTPHRERHGCSTHRRIGALNRSTHYHCPPRHPSTPSTLTRSPTRLGCPKHAARPRDLNARNGATHEARSFLAPRSGIA